MKKDLLVTDVLIIGGGIAGAASALELARKNKQLKILVLTKNSDPTESNTRYAQGGIIAKGGESLEQDILKSGDGLCKAETVTILANEGPILVDELLVKLARVPFDKTFALEGGHSEARIAKVADYTGKSIQEHLVSTLKKYKNIQVRTDLTAIDLLTLNQHSLNYQQKYKENTCVGAYVFERKTGKTWRVLAKKIILATGGTGQIYAFTTNPDSARGDGIALAFRAGARLLGLEFEQFHPTALKVTGAPPFLISEAVRGSGARLTNEAGVPFMQKYYPDLAKPDLTTRDKVSRAIFTEMLLTGKKNVYLDLKNYISGEEIRSHFPTIKDTCSKYGINIEKDLIPVSPAAHYLCGGVLADIDGQTNVAGLYAVGEVACSGLHGGNRLASTSLLEGLVFGVRAARQILKTIKATTPWQKESEIKPWVDQGKHEADMALITTDINSIKNTMWNMVGLVRKTKLLKRAVAELTILENTVNNFYSEARLSSELLSLRNMVLVALLTAKSALANQQSAGCHYLEET